MLDARGLTRRFGAVTALSGVDLQVEAGQVTGLMGPNGAGKTTAFRLLAGLDRPDAGTVLLGGVDVSSWPLHRRARAGLGYLPQGPSLLSTLSAADNVAVALRAVGRKSTEATGILAAAGLAALARRPAGALSGGERRRVEIARCLAGRPRVVLLDEPFAGVDPAHVRELRRVIRAMAEDGIAVLLTDHAVRDALPTCDAVVLLDHGSVQIAGTPAQIAADGRARDRYLGHDFCLE